MRRRSRGVALLGVLCLSLSGCGVTQLSRISVVTSLGLDPSPQGITLLCELGQQNEQGYRAKGKILKAEDANFAQAMVHVSEGRDMLLNHVEILVVDESIAEKGLREYLSNWQKETSLGLSACVVIARKCSAQQVLESPGFEGEIPGLALKQLLQKESKRGRTILTPLLSFLTSEQVVVPAVTVVNDTVTLAGKAKFFNGEWRGFVEQEE